MFAQTWSERDRIDLISCWWCLLVSVVKLSFIGHPRYDCECVAPGMPKNRITSKDLFFRRLPKLKPQFLTKCTSPRRTDVVFLGVSDTVFPTMFWRRVIALPESCSFTVITLNIAVCPVWPTTPMSVYPDCCKWNIYTMRFPQKPKSNNICSHQSHVLFPSPKRLWLTHAHFESIKAISLEFWLSLHCFNFYYLVYDCHKKPSENLKGFGTEGLLLNVSTHTLSIRLEESRLIPSPKAVMTEPRALWSHQSHVPSLFTVYWLSLHYFNVYYLGFIRKARVLKCKPCSLLVTTEVMVPFAPGGKRGSWGWEWRYSLLIVYSLFANNKIHSGNTVFREESLWKVSWKLSISHICTCAYFE